MSEDTEETTNRDSATDEWSGGPTTLGGESADAEGADPTPEVPAEAVEEAERLTRLAEEAAAEDAADAYRERRAALVDDHDFTARVREADDTLVLYPDEWVEDGTVQFETIDDTDRAIEVSLSGPDHGAEWEAVEARNREIVEAVAEEHGPAHAANVRAFADFMGNHYLKSVADATAEEAAEFLAEYYPRNAWPSDAQESIVAESVELVTDDPGDEVPGT